MALYEQILSIYPTLTYNDFAGGPKGTIFLENASDGKGDYIAKWEHPTLTQPTAAQLTATGK